MDDSLAVGQRSMGDSAVGYPLWPPLVAGCPTTSTAEVNYPVEVDYDYARLDAATFLDTPGRGLQRYRALLPPLLAPGLGEGSTALVELADGVWIKDESRNPTWSHKDRLNRCAVSAAVGVGAPGVVVASSGNHGASAAAYAARAGLASIVLLSAGAPPAVASFVRSYGGVVLPVRRDVRWGLLRRIVDELGFHPVSNLTDTHTGHAYGPEGYKTISYEIVAELGVPAAVYVPVGHGELLFGIWKGFEELRRVGITDAVPRLYSCEPATGGPLAAAIRTRSPVATVPTPDTAAYAIGCSVGSVRGTVALSGEGSRALLVSEDELADAQRELAHAGLWQEVSGAIGLAGLRQVGPAGDGPVVCVATSSGFKDLAVGAEPVRELDAGWSAVMEHLRACGIG
jgi:threonine synthase